jgi:transposase
LLTSRRSYDIAMFYKLIAIKAVIPPRSTRKVKRDRDFALYAERNLVERFFNTIIGVSRHATKKPRETSLPAYIWSAHSLGSNDDRP